MNHPFGLALSELQVALNSQSVSLNPHKDSLTVDRSDVGLTYIVTTLAFGEEGGEITTQALGEEGGVTDSLTEGGEVTTQALGEEGGMTDWGSVTTFALGEEGGAITDAIAQTLGQETGVSSGLFPETSQDIISVVAVDI